MSNIRLSRGLCAVVGSFVKGSHATLDALFVSAGAPGDPPDLAHNSKWKEWLFRAGQEESVDSLAVLGNILEEEMDVAPTDDGALADWKKQRQAVVDALEAHGLSYFRGGRVLPNGQQPEETFLQLKGSNKPLIPTDIEDLLRILTKGLPRAMHPLSHRRKGVLGLDFTSEYDIQDMLHALLRPWIADVRSEEFTPSYAGTNTRMDFLLPDHEMVIETKRVRDKAHGKKIGDELIIDIAHYRAHPKCSTLWCVVYDPNHHLQNAGGLVSDLEGDSSNKNGTLRTKVLVVQP